MDALQWDASLLDRHLHLLHPTKQPVQAIHAKQKADPEHLMGASTAPHTATSTTESTVSAAGATVVATAGTKSTTAPALNSEYKAIDGTEMSPGVEQAMEDILAHLKANESGPTAEEIVTKLKGTSSCRNSWTTTATAAASSDQCVSAHADKL